MSAICNSYASGHLTHWIPALRLYNENPRIPITFRYLGGVAFKVTNKETGESFTWFYHDPGWIQGSLDSNPNDFYLIEGTTFVTCEQPDKSRWFYLAKEPMISCSFKPWTHPTN